MKNITFTILLALVVLFSCDRREGINPCDPGFDENYPRITTGVLRLQGTDLQIGYDLTSVGSETGDGATAYGFVWSTDNPAPTLADSIIDLGTANSPVADSLVLENWPEGNYYFRAFVTNCLETSYGATRNISFDLQPELELAAPAAAYVEDDGNNDGFADAGERVYYRLLLNNTGVAPAQNVKVVVVSDTSLATQITPDTLFFGDIAAGASNAFANTGQAPQTGNPYSFAVQFGAPIIPGTELPFTAQVIGEEIETEMFSLIIDGPVIRHAYEITATSDGDSNPEPGELITISSVLSNEGTKPAGQLSVLLSENNSSYVESITPSQYEIPGLAVEQSVNTSVDIQLSDDIPTGALLEIEVGVTDGEANAYTVDPIVIGINAAVLTETSTDNRPVVVEEDGGNGILNQGESCTLSLQITNSGGAAASGIQVEISGSALEQASNNTLGNLSAGSTEPLLLVLNIPDDFPIGVSNIPITISTASGLSFSDVIELEVFPATTPALSLGSISIDDGNNMQANPGETVNLCMTLQNTGDANAGNIQLGFSAADQNAVSAISPTSFEINSIPVEGVSSQFCIEVQITPDAPASEDGVATCIDLSVEIDGQEYPGLQACFSIFPPPAPALAACTTSSSFTVQGSGNGDQVANPGESVDVEVGVINTGEITATGTSAVISSSSPFVVINEPNINFGNVPNNSGCSSTNFSFILDFDTPEGTVLEFSMASVACENCENEASFDFSITVGSNLQNEGLVLYYPFDSGSLTDESGNNHNGINQGIDFVSDGPSGSGQAAEFDGQGYGRVPSFDASELEEFTMNVWLKGYAGNYEVLFSQGSQFDATENVVIQDNLIQPGDNLFNTSIVSPLLDGEWHMLTVTIDAINTTSSANNISKALYVDGQLLDQGTPSNLDFDANFTFLLGSNNEGTNPFDGRMDNFRLYNKVLTPQEIEVLFFSEGGAPPTNYDFEVPDGLVAYYTFDQQSAIDIKNGFNGVPQGGLSYDQDMSLDNPSGYSAFFNGNSYFTVNNDFLDELSALTFNCWIKSYAGNYEVLLSKGSQFDDTENFAISDNQLFPGDFNFTSTVDRTLLDGNWHMLTVMIPYINTTSNASSIDKILYIDGEFVESGVSANFDVDFNALMTIGRASDGGGAFDGYLDNIRIYNRVLADTEVDDIFQSEGAPNQTAYPFSVPDNLVAYYTFDNQTVADVKNGFNGIVQGNLQYRTDMSVSNPSGRSAFFDGNSYFTVNNNFMDELAAMTFNCWVRGYAGNGEILFSKGSEFDNTENLFILDNFLYPGDFAFSNNIVDDLLDGQWHMLSIVFDEINTSSNSNSIDKSLYVDGTLLEASAALNFDVDFDAIMSIGAASNGVSAFDGYLDNIRIYNTRLTASEISAIYTAEGMANQPAYSFSTTDNLIAYYPFENNTQEVINGYNAITPNGLSYSASAPSGQGSSAVFSGGQFLQINNNYLDELAEMALSFWIRSSDQSGMPLLNKGSVFDNTENIYISSSGTICPGDFCFSQNLNNSLLNNQWHHVVINLDQINTSSSSSVISRSLYLDGMELETITNTNLDFDLSFLARFGADSNNQDFLNGLIDNLRIYNRPLNASEVQTLYNNQE
ncbi:MAG: LamG-like jellyroll fold domain-containing protein [Phaeodactylibacter sp.]|uniref:LamG-like jellyroll fold domain-containing protein n=1 Tax=Phaeodactylibacter sp. TaxID=1940289 RepID=UPI0032ED7393